MLILFYLATFDSLLGINIKSVHILHGLIRPKINKAKKYHSVTRIYNVNW